MKTDQQIKSLIPQVFDFLKALTVGHKDEIKMMSEIFGPVVFLPQVLPHVLLVCQPGLCSSDPAADT